MKKSGGVSASVRPKIVLVVNDYNKPLLLPKQFLFYVFSKILYTESIKVRLLSYTDFANWKQRKQKLKLHLILFQFSRTALFYECVKKTFFNAFLLSFK